MLQDNTALLHKVMCSLVIHVITVTDSELPVQLDPVVMTSFAI